MASLNIDIDIDIDQKSIGFGLGGTRVHPGSDLPNALIDHKGPLVPSEKEYGKTKGTYAVETYQGELGKADVKYPAYHKYWDAELQSYTYLNAFLAKRPDWLGEFAEVALQNRTLPQAMDRDRLTQEVTEILRRVKDRGSRAREIIVQDTAAGALGCWFNLLGIDPVKQPATNLLVRVGRRIGEHVVMCLKDHFKSPRPSQLCLAINPLIDAPATPSFPAGHALQAYLISYLLAASLKNLPQHKLPEANPENAEGLLFEIARRISDNRMVAGIHYPVDIEAGRDVAIACFKALQEIPEIQKLQLKVARELKQYA